MQQGWIKLHRKITNWEWYQDSQMVHLFLHLVMSANSKKGSWKGVEVGRGQLITGRKKLSEITGISERSIRTCIKRLKATSEVTIKVTSKYSLITVCNYDDYQPLKNANDQQSDQQSDQQVTSKRPASDHKQEVKNIRSKEVKTNNTQAKTFRFACARPEFVTEKEWNDILDHRKAVKAAMTELAHSRFVSQLKKAIDLGFTVGECVGQMSDRSWKGFKAEWMPSKEVAPGVNGQGQSNQQRLTPRQQYMKEIGNAVRADRELANRTENPIVVKGSTPALS